jgi:hypothetical protein
MVYLMDAVSIWQYIVSNDKMMKEYWTGREVGGSGLVLTWGTSINQELGQTEENH